MMQEHEGPGSRDTNYLQPHVKLTSNFKFWKIMLVGFIYLYPTMKGHLWATIQKIVLINLAQSLFWLLASRDIVIMEKCLGWFGQEFQLYIYYIPTLLSDTLQVETNSIILSSQSFNFIWWQEISKTCFLLIEMKTLV